ncbi:MAG: bifunctional folylpolyglutamate synthase/dihydrofolate synthase [Pseudobutyrivibrio sp.]|uniref:bifunctional folylpolyglutamate synthase/dihydrofolate synthase n=1 Tax=Pseudobutyrivibrio sp. TaxID=2014367 RepID=UPI0025F08E9B|nr:folylpolyglutamate synthase/dihydrofolate synthase family protein [Pseudobutyrivibrio sp.]MBQ8488760.1 bifunctional folylpolyglutamate synthase/dihydrofolate synthase [Pseudobutyrivibrio sp.]
MMKYSYKEAVDFFKSMPHFTPPADGGVKKDFFSLDAELALLEKLNRPQDKLKYVHIAGTNGKGSTTTYLANILNEASVVTGAFTSPFLYRYNEMFRVNGRDISDADFAEVFSQVKPAYDELANEGIFVSEYEFLTVMAFIYFIKMGCELVLLEVSMGGRMDTTNVIPAPLVSVITPISYDHMTILGNTLTEIATEKAGIIKSGTTVVSAKQEPEVVHVLEEVCAKQSVSLEIVKASQIINRDIHGQRFITSDGMDYETTMLGTYQIDNAAVAIAAARKLGEKGYPITEEAIRRGIANTKWFGRFTLLSDNPPVIIDGGHNRQGATVLRQSLEEYFPGKKITFVLGILADKEVDIILDTLLPIADRCYTLAVPNPRTMPPEKLAEMIRTRGIDAAVLSDDITLDNIKEKAEVVCIAGSLYLISNCF